MASGPFSVPVRFIKSPDATEPTLTWTGKERRGRQMWGDTSADGKCHFLFQ